MADSTAALAVIVKNLGRRVEAIAADLGELAKTVQASLAGEGKASQPGRACLVLAALPRTSTTPSWRTWPRS